VSEISRATDKLSAPLVASPRRFVQDGVELEVEGLTRRYSPQVTIGPISFEVRAGEFFSLLGPSGCGKTTTLRCIAGFETLNAGAIRLRGERLDDKPAHRRDVGLVFQNYALFPHLSVFDNVAFGLKLRRVAKAEIAERVGRVLRLVDLSELGQRFPGQLSGGQQQRVAIARSLVLEPRILMFDEPLSNLDFKLRIQMRDELKSLQRRLGKTAIYVTHDQTEALALSDRIAVLSHGHIEQIGTPDEIYERPATNFVAEFIGGSNLFPARIVGRSEREAIVETDGGLRLRCAADGDAPGDGAEVAVLLRPECIQLKAPGTATTPQHNCFPARIVAVTYLGEDLHLGLELATGQAMRAALKNAGGARFWTLKQPVEIVVDPADLRLLRR
jgi:spermidine/putrescine ABC transporter ATP-binding subunit